MTEPLPGQTKPLAAPTVSVLLTSYNRERYIAESIESVLAQTFEDFELIVSDDCSSDRTASIIADYARRDPRIRFSANAANIGDYANRRRAASLARGRFLKYHDSDDVMYRHCLATMVEPLESEPRAGFALSASHYWTGGPCPMLLTPALAYEREFLGGGLFHLGPSAALFRADVFRDLGGFRDEGVASDYLFWLRACAAVNVLLVPADLYYYRIHAGQELASDASSLAYARATSLAWRMLNAPECPLTGCALAQAKRNFLHTQLRGACRYARARRFGSAIAVLRHAGATPVDWLRYLRRPRRAPAAGTPAAPADA